MRDSIDNYGTSHEDTAGELYRLSDLLYDIGALLEGPLLNTIYTDTVYLFNLQSGSQVRLYVDHTDKGVITGSPVSIANALENDADADILVDGQPAERREVLKHVNPQAVVTAEEIGGPLPETSD